MQLWDERIKVDDESRIWPCSWTFILSIYLYRVCAHRLDILVSSRPWHNPRLHFGILTRPISSSKAFVRQMRPTGHTGASAASAYSFDSTNLPHQACVYCFYLAVFKFRTMSLSFWIVFKKRLPEILRDRWRFTSAVSVYVDSHVVCLPGDNHDAMNRPSTRTYDLNMLFGFQSVLIESNIAKFLESSKWDCQNFCDINEDSRMLFLFQIILMLIAFKFPGDNFDEYDIWFTLDPDLCARSRLRLQRCSSSDWYR